MKNKSLVEELKEEERKEKETQAKKAKEAVLHALSIHPLASESRDIRDAYLYGLVFAAIADDGNVDVAETVILFEIAKALSLPEGEVEEAISELQAKCAQDKMQLIAECVNALTGNKAGLNLFWAQFIQVWSSHTDSKDSLCCLLKVIAERSGAGLPASKVSAILSLAKGGDGVDKDLLALADWMGDDALKYFVVKKYGDVTDRLTSERNRKKRKLARKKTELLKKAERIKFATVIEQMSEAHKYEGPLRIGWDNELKECLSDLRADDIDWSEECKLRLAALDRIPHCYAKLLCSSQERPRRKIVWKLMCMLYVFGGTVRQNEQNEIDDLLRSATQLSTEGYRKRIENFIAQHFNVRVKVRQPESDEVIKPRFCK